MGDIINKIRDFFVKNLTLKLFMMMMINRIGDNIIFDLLPSYFSYFNEITPVSYTNTGEIDTDKTKKTIKKIYKEMVWGFLVIVLIISFSDMFNLTVV